MTKYISDSCICNFHYKDIKILQLRDSESTIEHYKQLSQLPRGGPPLAYLIFPDPPIKKKKKREREPNNLLFRKQG